MGLRWSDKLPQTRQKADGLRRGASPNSGRDRPPTPRGSLMVPDPLTQHGTLVPPEIRSAAARGWRLLPVRARHKVPLVKKWQRVATNNIAQLESWAA